MKRTPQSAAAIRNHRNHRNQQISGVRGLTTALQGLYVENRDETTPPEEKMPAAATSEAAIAAVIAQKTAEARRGNQDPVVIEAQKKVLQAQYDLVKILKDKIKEQKLMLRRIIIENTPQGKKIIQELNNESTPEERTKKHDNLKVLWHKAFKEMPEGKKNEYIKVYNMALKAKNDLKKAQEIQDILENTSW